MTLEEIYSREREGKDKMDPSKQIDVQSLEGLAAPMIAGKVVNITK